MIKVKVFGERHCSTRLISTALRQGSGIQVFCDGPTHKQGLEFLEKAKDLIQGIDDSLDTRNRILQLYYDSISSRFQGVNQWKHAFPVYSEAFSKQQVTVLFCVKDILPWLLSMHKRPYDCLNKRPHCSSLAEFIRSPYLASRREGGDEVYSNPIKLWNSKMASYLLFCQQAQKDKVRTMLVKSESLAINQIHALSKVEETLLLPRETLKPLTESTKEEKWKDMSWYENYYSNRLYLKEFSSDDIEFIDRACCKSTRLKLGYENLEDFHPV